MRLGELLADVTAHVPEPNLEITEVVEDSRRVRPGCLFVAKRGSNLDGRQFIPDAIANGARVIVGEKLPALTGAVGISVPDSLLALAQLAWRWHGHPERLLRFAGVTGTNGKTTTARMTAAILRAAGRKVGVLGTIAHDLGARSVPADETTPGALKLAAYLRECVDNGVKDVVMEVSSHALDQQRTAGLSFEAAAFTNLTGDHLDYHLTMEDYADAKSRLFSGMAPGASAVVNIDDPAHVHMLRECRATRVTYSLTQSADIQARITRETIGGTVYRLHSPGGALVLENALIGRHNVYNAMAAAGLALALGAPLSAVQTGLSNLRNVPGRLMRAPSLNGADIFVDYAHTDDALRNVLSVLRPLTRGQLTVVFGCGGERDRKKRPRMARVAAELADSILVTSDNPRREDPLTIIADILAGFEKSHLDRVTVEPDRKLAICAAVSQAREGDVVLIAGKGHETYQIVGTERRHFDDVEVAIQACGAEAGLRARG